MVLGSEQGALSKAALCRAFVASRHPCAQMGRIDEARALADMGLALRLAGSCGTSQKSVSADEFVDMFDCVSAAVHAAYLRAGESSAASAEAYVLRLIAAFDSDSTPAGIAPSKKSGRLRNTNAKLRPHATTSAHAYAYQVRPGQRDQRCIVTMYPPS